MSMFVFLHFLPFYFSSSIQRRVPAPIKVISYGVMITSVKVPSKTGEIADVALGFDTIEGMKLK